ncbi:ABC transporter ATP-binding protein [uncultured Microbacterium sp.]|uniref:ABC transporter ATP-binding protein n=1 Tax=uncultured Microbacterium sp. TaxID=191216 RepID=UPI0028D524A3|nr:ABC transporter ATP-binding protein [uncultured Microbacterium sp.]
MTDTAAPVSAPVVIDAAAVSKRFSVRKDTSLKERIVTLGRAGRRHRQDYWALSDVSMQVHAGTTIGLIGHNGSGKSTLLKVVGGIILPTTGAVRHRGRVAALLELGAGFHPDLTGRENVFLNAAVLGLSRAETEERFDAILDFSGVGDFIDTQVKFYSSGMYVRLAFAVAVHTDPDILLVDEVLAVGDEQFQKKCLDKIREFQEEGRTIIIVSHALDQIEAMCDRVILLNRGQVALDGAPKAAIDRFRELLSSGEGTRGDQSHAATHSLEIARVELCRRDGTAANRFAVGETIALRIHVRAISPVERWAVGFSINTPHGQLALASNSDVVGTTLAPISDDTVVEFMLADVGLGPGEYFVNANAVGRTVPSSHSLTHGAAFFVEGGEGTIGPVAATVSLSNAAGDH